jgi:hypothetical protein
MLMFRMSMYGPKFAISIRNKQMDRVTHWYGWLPLPLCFFGECSGSYSIRCNLAVPAGEDQALIIG